MTLLLCVAVGTLGLHAQDSPAEVVDLAQKTATAVQATHFTRIFLASDISCQLAPDVCASFEVALHAALQGQPIQFIERDDVISHVLARGFLAVDIYMQPVLAQGVAAAGGELLVEQRLAWQADGYRLTITVYDAPIAHFGAVIERPVPDAGGVPLMILDPAGSGVSLIVYRGKVAEPDSWSPRCLSCPQPSYSEYGRRHRIEGAAILLATVTDQGAATQISIVKDVPGDQLGDLSGLAKKAVGSWKFRPAMDNGGKAFTSRITIEVNFRLQPRTPDYHYEP